ncbi:hypothetical protein ID47_11210 [Candidatus Paracaedibacter acanthamoebae]|uniref:Uncharacterized protein n=1 Tax=Candidatus Odyssella acanthamoebae TaxID=91604 RepID=A0A077AVJ7_9PROT|nr:hypothetical protein ID47_11210 [Candidatus Paracaedibacter acanthamoebae]
MTRLDFLRKAPNICLSVDQSDGRGMACPFRGKSGLRRAGWRITSAGVGFKTNFRESATEIIPQCLGIVRVKWCGKSAPRFG